MSNVTNIIRPDYRDHKTAAGRSAAVWGDGHGLTQKQEIFAQNVADGLNHSESYRRAYDTDEMASNTIWREAHRLSRHKRVAARICQLIAICEQDDRAWAATRAHRVTDLLERIMASSKTDSARLRAAELLGKTIGLFTHKEETPPRTKTIEDLEQELAALLLRRR